METGERNYTDLESDYKSQKVLNTKKSQNSLKDDITINYNESIKGDNLGTDDNTDCMKRIKDLEEKMTQQRDRFKKLKDKYEKQLEEKDDKIDDLEDSVKDWESKYNTLMGKYNKLKANFDEISRELDEHLDKVGVKNISQKLKPKPRDNPLEIIIKMKEKEIKNTVQLMEVLRKNNEQLNKNLDNYTNVTFITDLQNKLNLKEKENQELLIEIKTLNRGLEEHKRCGKIKKETDEDYKNLKDELRKQKDSNRDLQQKLKEEVVKHIKTKDSYINYKREIDDTKRHKNININDPDALKKLNTNIELDRKKVSNLNHDPNIQSIYDEEKPKEKKNLNRSLDHGKKVFSKDDIDNYEKKIETLERSKLSTENKLKADIKQLSKKIQLLEDQVEYISNQYKESEQKNKILHYQGNEYKNEKKVYQRKINELQSNNDRLTNSLKEREQENNILTGQLKDIKKTTRHHAVPPMNERREETLYLTDIKKVSFTEDESEIKSDEKIINQKDESYEASVVIS
jgi:hypothetical protein